MDRVGSKRGRASVPSSGSKRAKTGDYQGADDEVLALGIEFEGRKATLQGRDDDKKWTGPFIFAQLADTQLGMLTNNKGLDEELAAMDLAVSHINRLKPAFVVVCGDLINAFPSNPSEAAEQTAAFKKAARRIDPSIPLVCVCGNHDIGNVPNAATIKTYTSAFGPDYFTFWSRGVKFIVMNSSLYKDASSARALGAEHDNWFTKELALCKTEAPHHSIVFAHIPPFIYSPDEPDGYFNWDSKTRSRVLAAMKDAGVRAMFCGHYHRNAGGKDEDLEVIVTSAVGCQLRVAKDNTNLLNLPVELDEPAIGPMASGLRLVRVGQASIRHRWFLLGSVPQSAQPSDSIWSSSSTDAARTSRPDGAGAVKNSANKQGDVTKDA